MHDVCAIHLQHHVFIRTSSKLILPQAPTTAPPLLLLSTNPGTLDPRHLILLHSRRQAVLDRLANEYTHVSRG